MKGLMLKKILLLGLIATLSLLAVPLLTNFPTVQPVVAQEAVLHSHPLLTKAVLSYLFETSDPEIESSLESLKESLQLTNHEFEALTQAAHIESEALHSLKSESNRLTELTSLTEQETESINFNQSVSSILQSTQTTVQKTLGAKYPEFRKWIKDWWNQERAYRNSEIDTPPATNGRSYKVFATQYAAKTDYEVGLPDGNFQSTYYGTRPLPYKVPFYVDISFNGKTTSQFLKAVGPWNENDRYWPIPSDSSNNQRKFQNLPQGHPEAFEAYFNNFNAGKDEFGRQVVDPAGVELSPAAAAKIGLKENQNAYVTIRLVVAN